MICVIICIVNRSPVRLLNFIKFNLSILSTTLLLFSSGFAYKAKNNTISYLCQITMRANWKNPTDLEILYKTMKVKLYNIRQRNINFKELQQFGKKSNSSNVNENIRKDIQSN